MIVIERGSARDLDALLGFHYRSGRPATIAGVWRARGHGSREPAGEPAGELVGVLVASYPTLNGSWRELAWPGRYRSGDKRRDARRLNREVRCLSRVIVEPRWRGLGVARRLVEHYLADPLTPATEAVASMGAFCPFFERSGMTAYRLGWSEHDARLGDALARRGVEAWRLMEPRMAARAWRDAFLARELARWARRSRATRGRAGLSRRAIAQRAAGALVARPVAYAHSAG
jgi:predicted GNAT family acetyltransferase